MKLPGKDATPTTLVHPNVEVVREGFPPKSRYIYRIPGVAPEMCVGVHNNTLVNLERAVLERVFYCKDFGVAFQQPPVPVGNYFSQNLQEFTRRFHRHCAVTTRASYDEFVNCYKGRKREIYRQAAESLQACGITRHDARIKPFVKAEKINFSAKPDPAPRLIQPRAPRFNVEVGRYIKNMEKPFYKAIDEVYGRPTVTKGLDPIDTAQMMQTEWQRYHDPIAIASDAMRFDQHVHEPALRWEHGNYIHAAEHNDRTFLAWLLRLQLRNRCKGYVRDGYVRYTTIGKRMSGDMNTAQGNVQIMCAMCWEWIERAGLKGRVSLINNGDDCVFILERKHEAAFKYGMREWFLEMGFAMDLKPTVDVFEEIDFCQSRPVWNGKDWNMVRCPVPGVGKDTSCLTAIQSKKDYFGWLAAVGQGGAALAGDMPIYWAIYTKYQEAGKGYKPRYDPTQETGFWINAMLLEKHGHTRDLGPPTLEARVSFWAAFGIAPNEQVAIESHISNLDLTYEPEERLEEVPPGPIYLHKTTPFPGLSSY